MHLNGLIDISIIFLSSWLYIAISYIITLELLKRYRTFILQIFMYFQIYDETFGKEPVWSEIKTNQINKIHQVCLNNMKKRNIRKDILIIKGMQVVLSDSTSLFFL